MHTETEAETALRIIDPLTTELIARIIFSFDTLMTAPDVARMLGQELGNVRAWDDTLADMRRSRSGFHGLRLLPYGTVHDGRAARPMYLLSAVRAFISAATPLEAAKPTAATARRFIRVDPSNTRHWKVRNLGATARS